MMDQAEKLRSIINKLNSIESNEGTNGGMETTMRKKTRVITVTSGKGGVGKTNFSINLAILLSEMGNRVVIIDADIGLANVEFVLGIMPQYTLLDVINDDKEITDILIDGPNNIKFISGGSGVEELIKLEKWQLDKFMEQIIKLDELADIIIVDTGAGISDSVLSFIMAAQEVILIATPEPTSLTDAYALMKMVSKMDNKKQMKIVVNKAEDRDEAEQILKKLTMASEKFLSFKTEPLGYILDDYTVTKAVKRQQPFIISNPKSVSSKQLREIANRLVEGYKNEAMPSSNGFKGFVNKLVKFLNV